MLTAENLGAPQKFVQSGVLDTKSKMTSSLLFHPYETVLVAVDEKNVVNFWNYEAGSRLASLDNAKSLDTSFDVRGGAGTSGSGSGSNSGAACRTTALAWINPDHNSLLATATDDGVARVWRAPCSGGKLVAAWRAMPNMTAGAPGAGMVMEWQQARGFLVTGGHSNTIAIWDVAVQRAFRKFKVVLISPF